MGLIYPGVPKKLALTLAKGTGADVFVETGTLGGETAAWAASHFKSVISIEIDETLHQQASTMLAGQRNVQLLLGRSEHLLPEIARSVSGPAIFWLDAHYSGPGTGGEEKECPLLDELAAVKDSRHIVMVDDVRMFLNGPGGPCKASHWPALTEVLGGLDAPHCSFAIHDDVLFRFPENLRARFEETARDGRVPPPKVAPAPPPLWRRLLSRLA